MDNLHLFWAIVGIYILVVVSPGPNFVLVTRYAISRSAPLAFALTFGIALGASVNASLTMFGIGALIIAYPLFGIAISLLGGGFLLYMGISILCLAVRKNKRAERAGIVASFLPPKKFSTVAASNPAQAKALLLACNKGFFVNLFNPKGIAFFVGLYAPLIVRVDLTTKIAVLGAGFLIETVWYGTIILLLTRSVIRKGYERSATVIDVTLGWSSACSVFVSFGRCFSACNKATEIFFSWLLSQNAFLSFLSYKGICKFALNPPCGDESSVKSPP